MYIPSALSELSHACQLAFQQKNSQKDTERGDEVIEKKRLSSHTLILAMTLQIRSPIPVPLENNGRNDF
jgi:hypothetical protein